jgi:RNA processing factor Prp31
VNPDAEFWRSLLWALLVLAVVRWWGRGGAWRRTREQASTSYRLDAFELNESAQEARSRLDARVAELENRLDFAERLLAPSTRSARPADPNRRSAGRALREGLP